MHGGRLDVESRTEEESEDGSRKCALPEYSPYIALTAWFTPTDGSIFKVTIP